MTLIEHLGELRSRIIKAAVVFFVASIVAFVFVESIFKFLLAPAEDSLDGKLYATGVAEQFIADMKLALFAALLFTIPVLIYQIWAFVVPAVGDMGRAFTYILVTLSSSLFLGGVAFGYYFVLPVGLPFLLEWAPDRYEVIPTSKEYMAFMTRSMLASGIAFELPAATYVAARLELVDASLLKRYRRHAIVANALLAAALTPSPDPFSMFLLAVPLLLLYELSIVIARYVNPTTEVEAHALDRDDDPEDETDEPEDYEPEDHEENGHERDL